MKALTKQDLSMILGGSSQPADYSGMTCAALQNHCGMFSANWDDAEWERWLDAYAAAGCTMAVVTPSQPNPTTPGT